MRTAALGLSALLLAGCTKPAVDDEGTPILELPQILIDIAPICLSYEPTTVGETRNYTSLLRNNGRQQLAIGEVTISGDERGFFQMVGVEPKLVDTLENAHAMIRYKPQAEGWDVAYLAITSNAQNYPLYRHLILALARPEGAGDDWDPGPKPEVAGTGEDEACRDDYKPRR